MSRLSKINKTLKDKIDALSTEKEKLESSFEEKNEKIKSDFGIQIFDTIKNIISESEGASTDVLSANIDRIDQLENYITEAKLGKTETKELLNSTAKTKQFLKNQIKERENTFKSAASIVGKLTQNFGGMVENVVDMAFGNDPLVNLAAKALTNTGGFLKNNISKALQNKLEKNNLKKNIFKQDAQSLFGKAIRPQKEFSRPDPMPGFDTPAEPLKSEFQSTNTTMQDGAVSILQDISKDVKAILTIIQSSTDATQDFLEDSSFDGIEAQREGAGKISTGTTNTTDKKSGGILDSIKKYAADSMMGSIVQTAAGTTGGGLILGGLSRAAGFAGSPVTWAITSIMLSVVDGIQGWLNSEEWGVSKVSGVIGAVLGGAGAGVMNAFAASGKWALAGAAIGFPFGGPFGAAVGGIIGAMLGGLLGYIGGEKISKFFDAIGTWIKDTYNAGAEKVKNFFGNVWNWVDETIEKVQTFFTDSIDYIISIPEKVKNFFLDVWDNIKLMALDVSDFFVKMRLEVINWINQKLISIMQKDPTGMAQKTLGPLADELNSTANEDIQRGVKNSEEREKIQKEMQVRSTISTTTQPPIKETPAITPQSLATSNTTPPKMPMMNKNFEQTSKDVMSRLMKDFNLTEIEAAAIIGNLGHESAGLQAGIQEKNVKKGRGGLGWAQWTGPRRVAFEKFLVENNMQANDPEANYKFLAHELNTTHKYAVKNLKKAPDDLYAKMMNFEQNYEAAGVKHYDSRFKYAQRALNISKNEQPQIVPVPQTMGVQVASLSKDQAIKEKTGNTVTLINNSPTNVTNAAPQQMAQQNNSQSSTPRSRGQSMAVALS